MTTRLARVPRQYAPLLVWLAYVVVPVEGWFLFRGRPLGFLSTVAVALVGWLWFARRSLPLVRFVAAALIFKLIAGTTLFLPRGFDARYYSNAEFAGAPERGFDPASESFTRIDRRLRFGGGAAPDFPLQFFNDKERFNYTRADEPDRKRLPVSIVWHGLLRVPADDVQRLYVKPGGATVTVFVGDRLVATIPAADAAWSGDVTMRAGFEPITLAAAFAGGATQAFEAGRVIGGREEPFDSRDVFRRPASRIALAMDAVARGASMLFDLVLGVWLVAASATTLRDAIGQLRRRREPRDGLAVAWAVVVADAAIFALPALNRLAILSGGDDWLTYESYARDIGLNALWMPLGATLGHGEPFYYQPFYPYFLAVCHWLFGDGLFGVYLVQRVLAGATVVALWRLAAMLFGERIGGAALVAAVAFVYAKLAPWTGILLTESLFVPAITVCAYMLVRLVALPQPGKAQSLLVGALGGIATLTRTSLVLGWGLVLPAVAIAMRGRPRQWSTLLLLVAAIAAVMSLATLRNWVAARQFVPVATSGSTVLHMGNAPGTEVAIPAEHQEIYKRLGFDWHTQAVVEYARQQPRAFLDGWATKARYTLGWFDTLAPADGRSLFYIVAWATALAGVVLLPWTPSPMAMGARLVPLLLALSSFATAVIFHPHIYRDRLILPFYVLLVPYAAISIAAAYRGANAMSAERTGAFLWLVVLAACLAAAFGAAPDLDAAVLVGSLLVAVPCIGQVPSLTWRRVWPYAPLALGTAIWFWGTPTRQVEGYLRADWLMLATALLAGVYVASARSLTWAAALLCIAAGGAAVWALVDLGVAGIRTAVARVLAGSVAYADWAAVGAVVGLLMLGAITADRRRRASGIAAFCAGVALALCAWQPLNHGGTFSWALVVDTRHRIGLAGAASLLLVWIRAAWPVRIREPGWPALAVRMLQGGIVAIFIAAQAGLSFDTGSGLAMLMVAGLLMSAVEAHRDQIRA